MAALAAPSSVRSDLRPDLTMSVQMERGGRPVLLFFFSLLLRFLSQIDMENSSVDEVLAALCFPFLRCVW